ncbi:hypothetical protein [Streptomyces sp. NPDC006997]|uniref:hypothetical protein n=1 Tax=Streptomyces sp. NPDC006997 TaxID=3155356 RepID=UPI0033E52C77
MNDQTAPTTPHRGAADPVRTLMHRHRDLCERAVDPLEIAAALEAHGLTDRSAARFRHRDVFSLAEEMYARSPRDTPPPTHRPPHDPPLSSTASHPLRTLLPAALAAAAVTVSYLPQGGPTRLLMTAAALLTVTLAVRGPLPATPVLWLLTYVALGDGLLQATLTGGPDALPTGTTEDPWPLTTAPLLTLALVCAPAAWCTRLFASTARRRLTASPRLGDFTSAVRPLLLATVALYLTSLAALLAACTTLLDQPASYAQTLTLGALLFLARLLAAHGRTHAPTLALTAAATTQTLTLAALLTARLPGCAFLATPVESAVATWGPGAIPAVSCAAAALALLLHATRTLTRATAHAPPDGPC